MLLSIDKNMDSNYIYKQIYEGIKEKILNKHIQSNEKLPSKRVLADQLKVSVNSVSNAYEQLLAEGYIYTIERKGYYVENITQFIEKVGFVKNELPEDLKEALVSKEGWLSLSHMTSDISNFPFKEWRKCQQQAIQKFKKRVIRNHSFTRPLYCKKDYLPYDCPIAWSKLRTRTNHYWSRYPAISTTTNGITK